MINNLILRWMQLATALLLSIGLSQFAIAGTETITYYHNDISGTPMLATDVNGNSYWKEAYLAFGIKITNSSNASTNKIGYAGKPYDNNTRLSYMGARYYSPDLGRFMAVDPVGFDPENIHSFNRYAYANNNPYKYVDPDGHSPIDVAFLVYDIGKLGVAVYTGVGIGAAAVDVGLSAVGVLSPIPGTGQVLKAERIVERTAEVANVADKAIEAGKAENRVVEAIPQIKAGSANGETAGQAFPKSIKDAAKAENPQQICVYCRREGTATQVDHAIPKSRGGNATIDNAQMACPHCNPSKGAGDFPKTPPPDYVGKWPPGHW